MQSCPIWCLKPAYLQPWAQTDALFIFENIGSAFIVGGAQLEVSLFYPVLYQLGWLV